MKTKGWRLLCSISSSMEPSEYSCDIFFLTFIFLTGSTTMARLPIRAARLTNLLFISDEEEVCEPENKRAHGWVNAG